MISQPMVQRPLQYDAQDIAEDVAHYAHAEHERDKKSRLSHYKDLGWKPDDTVKPGE